MMLSRRLILMIALMFLHSEVNAVLACPARHAARMTSGPALVPVASASGAGEVPSVRPVMGGRVPD
jgi:hypothetical protein